MAVAAVIVSDATDISLVQRALSSVLYQTCPVDEIVIVEAKRRVTNDLEELVRRTDRKVLLEHYHCYNASMARNHGASLCRSEYICFLDSDDEWSPHMIEDRMALMEDGVCMVTSKYAVMTDKNGNLERFMPVVPAGTELYGRNIIGSNSYVMLRKDIFHMVGGFDPQLVYHQDWDLWIRMLRHGRIAISPMLGGIRYFNHFSASMSITVCRKGWLGFADKWAHIHRREHEHTESIARLYAEDMTRFGEPTYLISGPFGLIRRKILNRLPVWTSFDFWRGRHYQDINTDYIGAEQRRRIQFKGKRSTLSRGQV
jgi:glycosyltransferase involved in cell wall biosynthesis